MAIYEVLVPKNYADKVGGTRGQEQRVSIDAKNSYLAKSEITKKWGIPWGVVNSLAATEVPKGSTGTKGSLNLSSKANKKGNKEAVAFNKKFAVGADIGALAVSGPRIGGGGQATRSKEKDLNLGTEQSSSSGLATGTPSGRTLSADTLKKLAGIGKKATSGSDNQFLPDGLKIPEAQPFSYKDTTPGYVAPGTEGDFKPNPEDMRTLFPQGEGGMEGTDANLTDEQKAMFDAFDPGKKLGLSVDVTGADRTREERAGAPSTGDTLDTDQIIDMFYEGGEFGKAVIGPEGEEIINPLLSNLLLAADSQNNRVSFQQIADLEARSREQVAIFNKDAAIEIARQNNLSDAEVARLTTEADTAIATAAKEVDKYIADKQLTGTEAQATATAAAAESGRLGQEAAAESMAGGQLGAAESAAGAASPFGFMQQATTNDALQTPEQQLKAIYDQLNAVGLAQAGASNIGAQDNAFSFAAGQGRDDDGNLLVDATEMAQISSNTPAALAARAQEAAANAGATGFGALLSGDTGVNQQANEILRAQAANNPYAMQQLGQGWAGTGAADQNTRIDQILRGGLSADQRLAEINASQSGQNFANQLNFMSNPSAIGFATEKGLFGGQNNQVLQDINNSPEGNVPGSLFGFNSPSPAGAGGGATQNNSGGTTQNTSGAGGNFNANTLRNASDEQIGFLQGAASAGGQTQSEFNQQVESFTPQGY
jgi:hypothetical protein